MKKFLAAVSTAISGVSVGHGARDGVSRNFVYGSALLPLRTRTPHALFTLPLRLHLHIVWMSGYQQKKEDALSEKQNGVTSGGDANVTWHWQANILAISGGR